jgi:hypothetical protein
VTTAERAATRIDGIPGALFDLVEQTGDPQGTTIAVTPAIAGDWLARNIMNRPIRPTRVEFYAQQMKSGRWLMNGEPLIFSRGGALLNGQHRLLAVITANVAVKMSVQVGVDEAAFITLDQGARRSTADMFGVMGMEDSRLLAGAASYTRRWELEQLLYTGGLKPQPSAADLAAVVERHPGLRDAVRQVPSATGMIPRAMEAMLRYVCGRRDAQLAVVFFDGLRSGANLDPSDPVYLLRERLRGRTGLGASGRSRAETLELVIRAWNHARSGNKLSKLQLGKAGAVGQKIVVL